MRPCCFAFEYYKSNPFDNSRNQSAWLRHPRPFGKFVQPSPRLDYTTWDATSWPLKSSNHTLWRGRNSSWRQIKFREETLLRRNASNRARLKKYNENEQVWERRRRIHCTSRHASFKATLTCNVVVPMQKYKRLLVNNNKEGIHQFTDVLNEYKKCRKSKCHYDRIQRNRHR